MLKYGPRRFFINCGTDLAKLESWVRRGPTFNRVEIRSGENRKYHLHYDGTGQSVYIGFIACSPSTDMKVKRLLQENKKP